VVDNLRIPVRLGQDVFTGGLLEEASMQQVEAAFHRFKRVIEDFGVYTLRAVATSAMREASNGQLLADRIQAATGIKLEIIDGVEEAHLIHLAVSHVLALKNKRAMLIDIGGGSVEVTLSAGSRIISTDSYNMGALRFLKVLESQAASGQTAVQLITEAAGPALAQIRQAMGNQEISICVGTGGNVEEIGRLRQRIFHGGSNRFITPDELEQLVERLGPLSPADLVREYRLRPDRADVILAGAIVLQLIAGEARVNLIEIPNVGLKDGLLLDLAQELSHQRQVHVKRHPRTKPAH